MSLPQFTSTRKLAESSSASAIASAFNALVSNLQSIFTYLLGRVQLDSVILKGVSLSTGDNVVPHTLGRTLTGWSVVRLDAAVAVWDAQLTSPDPATYLILVASGPCTVSLEVF